jgi:hypothetical protein
MQLSDVALDTSRLRRAAAVATVLCISFGASAASRHDAAAAGRAPAAGGSYGGVTSQNFPVVLETARHGRQVARAIVAIRLTCVSGAFITTPDSFQKLTISKKGKFGASFGPETLRNDDGTTTDLEGSISGRFNSSRTRATGTWTFKATDHDGAGAVTDTCDSGEVSWTAKQ